MTEPTSTGLDMDAMHSSIDNLRNTINKVLIGQEQVVEQILIALFSNGHVLIEGVPGLGKTLLIRILSSCINGSFKRIQFTPDLMPADITGHSLFDMKEGVFRFRRGPVFTNFLLADEVNRSPAKTQAALLEVMQERQVTIDGATKKIPAPFMVMATQNPIEQEGTYPLPEAELDRFLMKIYIDFPSYEHEIALTKMVCNDYLDDPLNSQAIAPILDSEQIIQIQKQITDIVVDDEIMKYAVRLVRATRDNTAVLQGASPRACIGIIRSSRARALLNKRSYVLPDDVKAVSVPIMRHRISLSADIEIDGVTTDNILNKILDTVEAPRQ